MNTWRDFTMLLTMAFFVMVVWMLPHLNPPADEDVAEPPPPGNVIVFITWPEGTDDDVDLWVTGPGQMVAVGYSNKGGELWNLLRDDLGSETDATDLNFENAFTRGIIAGTYVFNIHCYRCPTAPVPVTMKITMKENPDANPRVLAVAKYILTLTGEEITMLRFDLTSEGTIVPGTTNHWYQRLRIEIEGGGGH